jgi:hypothetical protein
MLWWRIPLPKLLAALFALMVQLGVGAYVPNDQPDTVIPGSICHVGTETGGAPGIPAHRHADCLACPFCAAAHVPAQVAVALVTVLPPTRRSVALRGEWPPQPTAPPTERRPPSQPRAPPIFC